jgi:two-component system chemotaxis sensor kinase CheA
VGLDVVRKHVDVLRGFLAIESREGEGATITARLPLTLAIIPGFGVGAGGETYLVPLECVVETLALPPEAQGNGGRGVINLRGEPLPYFRLGEHFALGRPAASREHVVVVQHAGTRAGLAVDELYGESQTVIKPLGRLFQGLPGIAGSSVLGNGRVALILDVPALLREAVAGDTDG